MGESHYWRGCITRICQHYKTCSLFYPLLQYAITRIVSGGYNEARGLPSENVHKTTTLHKISDNLKRMYEKAAFVFSYTPKSFYLCEILTDGDDSKAWLLSAPKWTGVTVQPGSYRLMLSVRWKDKHRRREEEMKGNKRDWWRCAMLTKKKKSQDAFDKDLYLDADRNPIITRPERNSRVE